MCTQDSTSLAHDLSIDLDALKLRGLRKQVRILPFALLEILRAPVALAFAVDAFIIIFKPDWLLAVVLIAIGGKALALSIIHVKFVL